LQKLIDFCTDFFVEMDFCKDFFVDPLKITGNH